MLAFFFCVSFSLPTVTPSQERSFLSWMRETNQLFTGDEYHIRLGIWLSNQRFVKDHNSGKASFKLEMNHLAALSPSEYQSILGVRHFVSFQPQKKITHSNPKYPDSWDWCQSGSVCNLPQDQGDCGASWAFGAIESIESNYAIFFEKLLKLSEQNLVDCATQCQGCQGKGSHTDAIDYIVQSQNGSVEYEESYPYAGVPQSCSFDPSKSIQVVSGYVSINKGDEEELAERIFTTGVASIAIDASNPSFQFYKGGIYEEPRCSSSSYDHTVACVGFGVDSSSGKRYWIVKNSWGTKWGEKGYIRMLKDKGNQCAVATFAIIATPSGK